MKRILSYLLLPALALATSCTKVATEPGLSPDMGALAMNISLTRSGSSDYDPMEHYLVSIYNTNGDLLRRYRSQDALPARLELLAGTYKVEAELGESRAASFSARYYKGASEFTISAGAVTQAEVMCNIQNTVVEVAFDPSVAQNFGSDFSARVIAADTYTEQEVQQGAVPSLKYTADRVGYFTMPEGVTTLSWIFLGEHPDSKYGTVDKRSKLLNVKSPGRYKLTFKFSPDLPGYIDGILIKVDTTVDPDDDTVVFNPAPVLKGANFDPETLQRYVSGDRTYTVSCLSDLKSATLEWNGQNHDLLTLAAAPAGDITVVKSTSSTLEVTLTEAFFASSTAGDHAVKFHITDVDNGELKTESPYRIQGLIPATARDFDLWSRTATLRYVSFGDAVNFSLREKDGTWRSTEGVKGTNDVFVAEFAPAWTESTNSAGLKIFTMSLNNGISPTSEYEYKASAGGVETPVGTITTAAGNTIPDGDMEDSNLPCFSKSGSESSNFWASGNAAASGLCQQGTKSGMGGQKCAVLAAQVTFSQLAAGNLFSAGFKFSTTSGSVYFGVPYAWTARPKALRLKYHATVGAVNKGTASNYENIKDGQDRSRIFVAIVDWNSRHTTTSGLGDPSGVWDPTTQSSTGEGAIIGYGSLLIRDTTPGDDMVQTELPLYFYDKTTLPKGTYSLVISCATSAYGDYKVGCTTNVMYVDDFEWVY